MLSVNMSSCTTPTDPAVSTRPEPDFAIRATHGITQAYALVFKATLGSPKCEVL